MLTRMGWSNRSIWGSLVIWLMAAGSIPAQQLPSLPLAGAASGQQITDSAAIFHTEQNLSPGQAWEKIQQSGTTHFNDFGFTDHRYWVGLQLENLSAYQQWILEVENPHIDYITLYIRSPGTGDWIKIEQSGDRVPHHVRSLSHYNPALPIDFTGRSQLDLLVMLYKQHSSLNFNLRLWEQADFSRQQQVQYTVYGGYFGILLLVIIATGCIFAFSRKQVYLWYLLYILTIGLYILADTGLAHQFIYPGSATIPNYARMVLTYGFLFTFIPFTQHYFSTGRTLPSYHRGFNILLGLALLHFVVFTTWFLLGNVDGILALSTKNLIILLCLLFLLYHGVIQLGVNRIPARFYLAAFSAMLLSAVYKAIAQFGLVPRVVYPLTPLQIGFFFEIIILSVGMGWQVRQLDREQAEFRSRINKLQNEKLQAFVDGVDKERHRIARDLHDAVGSRLTHLKHLVERGSSNGLAGRIQQIITDVRSISHQLSPPGLQLTTLEQNIQQLVRESDTNSSIQYHLQILDLPEKLSTEVSTNVYRLVQEGINNIEKHSQADQADIQLINHGDKLVLTIEDDGVGLPAGYHADQGIGLRNLHYRVEQLNGTVEISSAPNRGTHILVVLPIAHQP
ncbi:7TM diverse intracellular signaling domain-containing protein [Halalkalibaculum sp. DA3122]